MTYELSTIIKSYDAGTHAVSVHPVGSLGTYWKDINVVLNILLADCALGRYCAVASFNDSNPTNAVVIAVWT